MSIGDKIKYQRKLLGMTQTELGEKLGVKTNAVSKWECGRVEDIPTSKIKAMAQVFNVPPSYLIDENQEPECCTDLINVVDTMTTGKRIKMLRTQLGMSQTELGEKVGVKTSAIYKYENGLVVNLKRSTIDKLAEALGTTGSYLMGYDDEQKPSTPLANDDPELTEYLETLRTRPEMRMLFSVSKDATKEDVEKAVAIIEALRKTEGR